jgi:hypothetical protein
MGFHRLGAGGAVAPRASEDDGDQLVSERASGGRQEAIDRRSGGAARPGVRGNRQGVVGDFDVAIGGDDIDDAGLQWLIGTDRAYRQLAAVGQDLAEVALAARIKMLSDHDRGREVAGKRSHEGEQRIDTPRRRTDDDEASEGFAVRLWNLSLVDSIRRVSHRTLTSADTARIAPSSQMQRGRRKMSAEFRESSRS